MSQETTEEVAPAADAVTETAAASAATTTDATATCQSPPPAPMPARDETPDPRARLLELAAQLMRSKNRRLIAEYLRLRRAVA